MALTDLLTRAQYSGLDFDTISDDLRAQLQVKFASSFNDFVASSQGIMLLDLVAFGLDTLSFYLDRRATDTYLATARTRKAVARLTRQLGYKMGAAVSASTDLDVTVPVYPFNVKVPKGFKFKGPNDLVFEAAQEITWAPGDVIRKKKIPVYEGETFTESFVSNGTANQVFELRRVPAGKYVVQGTVQALVNGSAFDESEFITFDTTNQFEVGYNDDPPTLRFGDGVAGQIPTSGSTISVTYVAARGKAGVVAKNTIQKELNPLVVNFQSISLTVNNPVGTTGGDDPEDLNHAKIFAGKVFKSRQVAVTREDYEALAGSFADPLFGRVAVAQAISSRSADTDIELQNNTAAIRTVMLNPAAIAGTSGTATTDATTRLATVATDLTQLTGAVTNLTTKTVEVNGQLTTARDTVRTIRNEALDGVATAGEATGDLNDAKVDVTQGIDATRTVINGIGTAGTSQLTVATKDSLLAALDFIDGKVLAGGTRVGSLTTTLNSVASQADSQVIPAISSAVDVVAQEIGLDAVTVGAITTQVTALRADIATQISGTTGIGKDITDIVAVVSSTDTAVETALVAIEAHVDKILASDCKANLVTVPILARDAAGFFTAPSNGLIHALQTYLDARKEVTQTVAVTSGANFLVAAGITTRVGVKQGYSLSVVEKAAEAALDTLLRDRKFGASLFVSDVVNAVLAVDGVAYVNAVISPPIAATVDAQGNLIVADSQVVTKGTVVVNTEAKVA